MEIRLLLDPIRDKALINHLSKIGIRGGVSEEARHLMKTGLLFHQLAENDVAPNLSTTPSSTPSPIEEKPKRRKASFASAIQNLHC